MSSFVFGIISEFAITLSMSMTTSISSSAVFSSTLTFFRSEYRRNRRINTPISMFSWLISIFEIDRDEIGQNYMEISEWRHFFLNRVTFCLCTSLHVEHSIYIADAVLTEPLFKRHTITNKCKLSLSFVLSDISKFNLLDLFNAKDNSNYLIIKI